jgi:uncharacterized protein
LILYLDASVLVAALTLDPLSHRAADLLSREAHALLVSDFARAEFASAIARRVRARELTRDEGFLAFAHLDSWCVAPAQAVLIVPEDVADASLLIRRLDLNLRTPDALHLAAARRLGATLATFDTKLADVATALNLLTLS